MPRARLGLVGLGARLSVEVAGRGLGWGASWIVRWARLSLGCGLRAVPGLGCGLREQAGLGRRKSERWRER